jgi:hypothetical protein
VKFLRFVYLVNGSICRIEFVVSCFALLMVIGWCNLSALEIIGGLGLSSRLIVSFSNVNSSSSISEPTRLHRLMPTSKCKARNDEQNDSWQPECAYGQRKANFMNLDQPQHQITEHGDLQWRGESPPDCTVVTSRSHLVAASRPLLIRRCQRATNWLSPDLLSDPIIAFPPL